MNDIIETDKLEATADRGIKDGNVVYAQKAADEIMGMEPETLNLDSLARLSDMTILIRASVDRLEAEQRDVLAPFRNGIAKLQARYLAVIGPLKDAMLRSRKLDADVRTRLRQERERAAAEANAREAARVEGAEALGAEVVPVHHDPEPVGTVRGTISTSYERSTLKVEIASLPAIVEHAPTLLMLDEARARQWLQSQGIKGEGIMDGIHYWTETSTVTRGTR